MAMIAYEINEGGFGDTSLEGVRFAWAGLWPGPIHEGGGTRLTVVDESASAEQREAIEAAEPRASMAAGTSRSSRA